MLIYVYTNKIAKMSARKIKEITVQRSKAQADNLTPKSSTHAVWQGVRENILSPVRDNRFRL